MSQRHKSLFPLVFFLLIHSAKAQEVTLPVPRAIIYPGDTLTESMLDERQSPLEEVRPSYIHARADLIGKIARRTLLPGQPIAASAVEQPRLVTIGAQVKLVYSENSLVIITFGVAQQAGGAGDTVRVRNLESGLFVTGRIQNDGSIRVGDS